MINFPNSILYIIVEEIATLEQLLTSHDFIQLNFIDSQSKVTETSIIFHWYNELPTGDFNNKYTEIFRCFLLLFSG